MMTDILPMLLNSQWLPTSSINTFLNHKKKKITHVNSLQNLWKSVCISFLELRKIRPFSVPTAITLSSCTVTHATSAFSLDMAEHCTHISSHQPPNRCVIRNYVQVHVCLPQSPELTRGWWESLVWMTHVELWALAESWSSCRHRPASEPVPFFCVTKEGWVRLNEMSGLKRYSEYKFN